MADSEFDLSEEEWHARLSPEQFAICRLRQTEPPFTGEYLTCKEQGVYLCVACGLQLFHSEEKYDSGTGWPSFLSPISPESLQLIEDNSHGMVRTEVLCARCDAHLGHLFPDGPPPAGLRFCINSGALTFVKGPHP